MRAASLPFSRLNRQVMAVGMADTLAYRGSFFLQLFFMLFPLVTSLLLWSAVFRGGGTAMLPGGFDAHRMLSYYLVTAFVGLVSFMGDMQFEVTGAIKDGQLNKFLVRPVNYIMVEWHLRMASVVINTVLIAIPAALVLFFARSVLVVPGEAWRWGAFLLSVFLGMQIGFLLGLLIGLLAFWMLETSAFLHALMPIQMMLNGTWFPLELLPKKVYAVLGSLPWAYQRYFSMKVYLGQLDPFETLVGLAIQTAWVLGLSLLTAWVWKRGIRRYGAVGG